MPTWFNNAFKAKKLDRQYEINGYLKKTFLEADFNGDGVNDIAALVIQKQTHKKGIILIEAKTLKCTVFGAGTIVGTNGVDASDDLKWLSQWQVYNKHIAHETTFHNGDIAGSVKRQLPHKGIII